MRKSPVRRQKIPPAAVCRVDQDDTQATAQYFQISVNVLEARKLVWSNPHSPTSYVVVVLGKKKHRTSIRRNMEEPYYREHFVFEMYATVNDVQRSSVWLAVMEARCCAPSRLLGETSIDLGAVWAQPHHQVFHKWAQLSLPRDPTAGPVGFLKVDISIIFRGDVQVMPAIMREENLDDNFVMSSGFEQQRANYIITIYGAFGLPTGTHGCTERRYGKSPSTFVRVSFCGLVAKTAVQYRTVNPTYSEQVSIVEMFPNMSQVIRLEVCTAEGCFNRVLAGAHLKLDLISHGGENGFLPTFGPSLLHMYGASASGALGSTGEDGPYHRGALLASLKTIVPYYQQGLRTISVEPVPPIKTDNLWLLEDFCIFCPILEVSMLDRRVAGKICGIAITMGEIMSSNSSEEEFTSMMQEIKSRKLHYTGSLEVAKTSPGYGYIDFPNGFPVLQLATVLPDFRFRMYRNNMVHGIVVDLEAALTDVERRLRNYEYKYVSELIDGLNKAVDDAAGNLIKFLDIVQFSGPSNNSSDDMMQQYSTELDQKQSALQKDEIEKIYNQITRRAKVNSVIDLFSTSSKGSNESAIGTRKNVKFILAESKSLVETLKSLIYKTSEGWPDIIVWLLNSGSRVGYCRISPADVIYSVIPEQNGRKCGRIQTLYLKPIKCTKHLNALTSGCACIIGKIELMMWMGLYRQNIAFENCLPMGYKLKSKNYDMCLKAGIMMLECRAFIYRAKLNCTVDNSNFAYAFVRINAVSSVKETKVKQKSLTPVWNEVLKIHKMVLTTSDRLVNNPPTALVEVYECELSGKTELLGLIEIHPTVDDRQGYEHAPKLQWYDFHKGVEHSGQILMSLQLLQVPEKLMKTTVYCPVEETFYASGSKEFVNNDDEVEPLPKNLIPLSTTYKVDVYWWGLRDVNATRKPCVVLEIDQMTIKSDVISEKKRNSNFPNGKTSQVFEAPLNEAYCPPLNIKLYDSSTFGRTLFLGTNVIKNPNKYVIHWIAKADREASIRSASIVSSNFCQVTQVLYVKKSNTSHFDIISSKSYKRDLNQSKAKISKWRRLFGKKQPDEEEYVLLPMFAKEKDQIRVIKRSKMFTDHKDWWLKYFSSQKDYLNDDNPIKDPITIYNSELESQPEFTKFKDWCSTLKFYNGKKTGIPEKDEQFYCGSLKAGIAIYKWPPPENTIAVNVNGVDLQKGFFAEHPNNDASNFLVRVYIVKGSDLVAKDYSGKSDPYVTVTCGKKRLGDRTKHVPNTAYPVFGKMYEFRCNVPEDYLLSVSIYDYESVPPDELIGTTTIDLEDRIFTKHRARVGLASEYNLMGPNKWRDSSKPSSILEEVCKFNNLPAPLYPDVSTVVVNGVEYRDSEWEKGTMSAHECKENICLNLLQDWWTMPVCGYHLVPEHVETRTLYNPDKPGIDQGKLHMWVDIFPLGTGCFVPPPINISPPKIEEYELRVIVWDVSGVKLDEIKKSKDTVDIYVRGWIGNVDQTQATDVYYGSINGEGSFNWRMIFHFHYQRAERMMVFKEKGPFTEFEERLPPVLVLQVMDSDETSPEHVLGTLTLNLNSIPRGEKLARYCTADAMEQSRKINLFSTRSVRAWWPLEITNENIGCRTFFGAVDLEMTLLPTEKAILMPVGLGRGPPSPLPEPQIYQMNEEPTRRFRKCIVGLENGLNCGRMLLLVIIILTAALFIWIYLYFPIFTIERGEQTSSAGHRLSRSTKTLYPLN